MPDGGVMIALGRCLFCPKVFAFVPDRVPSMRYPNPDGPREPVCRDCFERGNAIRKAKGWPLWERLPMAYADELTEGGALDDLS